MPSFWEQIWKASWLEGIINTLRERSLTLWRSIEGTRWGFAIKSFLFLVYIIIGTLLTPFIIAFLAIIMTPAFIAFAFRILSVAPARLYGPVEPVWGSYPGMELVMSIAMWVLVLDIYGWDRIANFFLAVWMFGIAQLFVDIF